MRRVLPWALALAFLAAAVYFGARLRLRPAESRNVSAAPVVAAMKKIAQLATVEVNVSDVVRYEEAKTWIVFDFPKSATLRLSGRVLGGFDLDDPGFRVLVDAPSRAIRIRLPRPRILAVDPRFEWFEERSGLINPITVQDRNRWMLWARGQLGRAAKDSGLEARAAEHARELLEAAAQAWGWTAKVVVAGIGEPAASPAAEPPASPVPPPPAVSTRAPG